MAVFVGVKITDDEDLGILLGGCFNTDLTRASTGDN
jgi:hypothetical protein